MCVISSWGWLLEYMYVASSNWQLLGYADALHMNSGGSYFGTVQKTYSKQLAVNSHVSAYSVYNPN